MALDILVTFSKINCNDVKKKVKKICMKYLIVCDSDRQLFYKNQVKSFREAHLVRI